ncbi:MAG: glycosyltransferase [Adhaeribacter sp.]
MNFPKNKTRLLFFIGSLCAGGKERRLIELLTYLKSKACYEMLVVVTRDDVHYPAFRQLGLPYVVLGKKWAFQDPGVFYRFYKICRQFRPQLIHTWGRMQSFYSLPAVIGLHIPLVNSQITSAPPVVNRHAPAYLLDRFIFKHSRLILANSRAGLASFSPPPAKSRVIYNGLNMSRFQHLPSPQEMKRKYHITTPYAVVMTANFTPNKNYDLFYRIADHVTRKRQDITFLGIGSYQPGNPEYKRIAGLCENKPRILFPGRISEVEALVNACDIGVLFSPNGEGISNAILEYMALGKPVVANDAGGNREVVHHHQNGYLVVQEKAEEIGELLLELLDNKAKYQSFSRNSLQVIQASFSLEKMGQAFELAYQQALDTSPRLSPRPLGGREPEFHTTLAETREIL